MLVDSHCHLDFPGLGDRMPEVAARMADHGVGWALCAGVTLERFERMREIVAPYPNIFVSVGVHPDTEEESAEADLDTLVELAALPKVVAIGETGLDYYRLTGDLEWQRERFRVHIAAARQVGKPLIVHTRAAAADTLRLLKEEGGEAAGGVFHCFTEDRKVARQALDLGFLISFSGIVTFKNATELKEVARMVPLDRLLVETDAPYLAPVPYRGKPNEPAYVKYVADEVAHLKQVTPEALAEATTRNFFSTFKSATR